MIRYEDSYSPSLSYPACESSLHAHMCTTLMPVKVREAVRSLAPEFPNAVRHQVLGIEPGSARAANVLSG